jgi:tetratricopeptide (TPR) repeat protein
MRRTPLPPHRQPTARTDSPAKATRSRLLPALLLLLGAVAALLYRNATQVSRQTERLYLADGVVLSPPPPLPESDLTTLQNGFRSLAPLRQAAREHPEDPGIQQGFAAAALDAGDPISALPAFRRTLSLTPKAGPELYDGQGRAQNMLGLCTDALATYRLLEQRFPSDARGYLEESQTLDLLNRRLEAVQALERGLAALSPDDVDGRLRLANQFDADGDTARALKEAEAVRSHAPTNPQAVLATVHLLIKTQRPGEARLLLEDLLARDPVNPHAHYQLGVVLDSPLLPERDPAQAENALLLAVREAPQTPTYYNRLAQFYQEQGKYRQCAYVSLQLLALLPDSAEGRLHLSYAYAHLGENAAAAEQNALAARLLARDQETAHLQMRVYQHPADSQANLALARHHAQYGQFGQALPLLESAYTVAPGDPTIRQELNTLCGRIGLSLSDLAPAERR